MSIKKKPRKSSSRPSLVSVEFDALTYKSKLDLKIKGRFFSAGDSPRLWRIKLSVHEPSDPIPFEYEFAPDNKITIYDLNKQVRDFIAGTEHEEPTKVIVYGWTML